MTQGRISKASLMQWIDWPNLMKMERSAYGHTEIMRGLFGRGVVVLAEWVEEDYQGEEAFAYLFPEGSVAIITDSFGSCSGCDSWEDSSDEEGRYLITELAANARLFSDLAEAIHYCETVEEHAEQYHLWAASNLLDDLRQAAERNNHD